MYFVIRMMFMVNNVVIFLVEFILKPYGPVQQMTCSLKQSFLELRNHFASEFNHPGQEILLLFGGKQ